MLGNTQDFWRDKRVFVTGHSGFKGGWLSIWLKQLGADVYGYSLSPDTVPSLYQSARAESFLTSEFGDIRDYDRLKASLVSYQPEILFHLAAQPLVRESYQKPKDTYEINIMGLVNTLEAARSTGTVKAIVNVTSDKCYENKGYEWGYRENDQIGGYDPYSNSKGCAELVSQSYRQSFLSEEGIAMATARAGNVIGGGDWSADRLIPDIIKAFQENKQVSIRNPKSIRPWQHVLEPISGYLMLAEKLYTEGQIFSQPYNFGPEHNDAVPVETLLKLIMNHVEIEAAWNFNSGNDLHEAKTLKLDISKAKHELTWYPKWGLDKAVKETIEWYQRFYAGEDAYTLCVEQIKDYTSS